MARLHHKSVAVIGASRGVGRQIALACAQEGAAVLAVARGHADLDALARQNPAIATLALDAAVEEASAAVLAKMQPDVLVLSLGAIPPTAPLPQLSWTQFSVNWEADVRASFEFCKRALSQPLSPGALVILVSSGAAIGGSPISGGYAGSKRTQMFIAQYAQRESDRLGLGLRFVALAPMGIMPETDLGRHAVSGYSAYLGISAADFVASLSGRPSVVDVVQAVLAVAESPRQASDTTLMVSAAGVSAMGKLSA